MCLRIKLVILLFLFALSANAGAGDIIKRITDWTDKVFYDQDTNYVKLIPREISVKLTNTNWLDFYNVNSDQYSSLQMRSDVVSGLSLSVGYSIFSLSYSVGLNSYFSDKVYDCSRFDFNMCWNKFSIEFGTYRNESQRNLFSYDNDAFDDEVVCSGLKMKMYKGRFLYYFNNKRYSNDASYSDFYRLQQIRSTGSFIAGASYSYHDMSLDAHLLYPYIVVPQITSDFKYSDYALNVGYGYNFVFAKRWLLNLTDVPEVGYKYVINPDKGSHVAINNTLKLVLLYNRDRCFSGLSGQFDSYWNFMKKSDIGSSIATVNLFVGVRF
ncbi:MAG TPA: DUF4421 family protein [Paludibacteraceae bacterium]|nr:DUF4421 family protein [Paludibacteraceae bacterium]